MASGYIARLRSCPSCGARVPWGTPQCLACGSHTAWQRLLAGFGVLVGAGTVAVVLAVIARVWLLPPPAALRHLAAAPDFVALVRRTADGDLVRGATRCADAEGQAICVELARSLDASERERLRLRLERLLRATENAPVVGRVVLVEAGGD